MRVFGVPIEVQPSFLLLTVFLGLLIHGLEPALLAWVVIATVGVLVHEAAHAAAFRAFDGQPRIILLASGGVTIGPHLGARRQMLVMAAGPVAGLALGIVVLAAVRVAPAGALPADAVSDALFVTFGWSLFNLLPLGGMDGQGLLEAATTIVLGRPAAATGRFVGAMALVTIVVATAVAGWLQATFMVVIVALVTIVPLGGVSRLFGAAAPPGGPSLLALGRTEEALAWSERSLARNANDLDAWLVRADALRLLGRWAEAEAIYDAALADHPGLAPALAGRFVVRRSRGLRADAQADLDALTAAATASADAVAPAFMALYVDDQFDAAARLIDEQLARPDLSQPERQRLEVLRLAVDVVLGRPETALPEIDRLLAVSPDDHACHELRALALIQLGRHDEARRSAERALAAAPRHPELLETRGLAERLAGLPDQALPSLVDAAVGRPNLPRARAELAACFAQLDRLQEANAALDGVPAWAADDANVTYARACLAARSGRLDEAAAGVAAAAGRRPALGRIAPWDPIMFDLSLGAPGPAAAGPSTPP